MTKKKYLPSALGVAALAAIALPLAAVPANAATGPSSSVVSQPNSSLTTPHLKTPVGEGRGKVILNVKADCRTTLVLKNAQGIALDSKLSDHSFEAQLTGAIVDGELNTFSVFAERGGEVSAPLVVTIDKRSDVVPTQPAQPNPGETDSGFTAPTPGAGAGQENALLTKAPNVYRAFADVLNTHKFSVALDAPTSVGLPLDVYVVFTDENGKSTSVRALQADRTYTLPGVDTSTAHTYSVQVKVGDKTSPATSVVVAAP